MPSADPLPIRRAGGGVAHNLHGTGAINLSGKTIGTVGAIGDTVISSLLIRKNAGPATVTLTGFQFDEDGTTARTLVLSGSTTVDVLCPIDEMVNVAAAATIQASVADTVTVWHRAP
jgi:hypothetical protein